MAKFRVIKSFSRGMGVDHFIGEVIDLDDKVAREFLFFGNVEPYIEATAAEPKPEAHPEKRADAIATQDNEPQAREPKQARGSRR